MMGQIIFSDNIDINNGQNQYKIDVSSFGSGFYLVNIKTKTGSSTQKLIVQ
jgi:hypothetical protein